MSQGAFFGHSFFISGRVDLPRFFFTFFPILGFWPVFHCVPAPHDRNSTVESRSSKRAFRELHCKVGGCKETLCQPFANPSPTFRQPFLPTPLQAPLSMGPNHPFRSAGQSCLVLAECAVSVPFSVLALNFFVVCLDCLFLPCKEFSFLGFGKGSFQNGLLSRLHCVKDIRGSAECGKQGESGLF